MKLTVCLIACFVLSMPLRSTQAEIVFALTNNNVLVNFDTVSPGTTTNLSITGLTAGDFLSDIDARPAGGALYGLANNGGTGRLYTIDRSTGVATLQSTLSTGLTGAFFGLDFNPTVDRLRIVSNTGQNLRVNVDSGVAIIDSALQFAAGDPNVGTPPQLVASAYTNNFPTATATTLFGLDLTTQSLVSQAPPNAGTLNTIGSLSTLLFPEAGFDISGLTGLAYAVLNGFELAQVNLSTGATTSLGAINAPSSIVGFAAQPGVTAVPEPSSILLLALGLGAAACTQFRRRTTSAQASVDDAA